MIFAVHKLKSFIGRHYGSLALVVCCAVLGIAGAPAEEIGGATSERRVELAVTTGEEGTPHTVRVRVEQSGNLQVDEEGSEFLIGGLISDQDSLFRFFPKEGALSYSNQPPIAHDLDVMTRVDVPAEIILSALDVDTEDLVWTILEQPTTGVLAGTAPNLTYTPNASFVGSDSFTFQVFDGEYYSVPARVSITIEEAYEEFKLSFDAVGGNYDEDAGLVLIPVNVGSPSDTVMTLSYSVDIGDHEADVAVETEGTAVLFPDELYTHIPVTIIDDQLFETTETITITLHGANLGPITSYDLSIVDNDRPELPIRIQFVEDELSIYEGGTAEFTVTLSEAADEDQEVHWSASPRDWESDTPSIEESHRNGTFIIPAGETEASFTITTADDNDSPVVEAPQEVDVWVSLSDADSFQVETALLTIIDDDFGAPILSPIGGVVAQGAKVTVSSATAVFFTTAAVDASPADPALSGEQWTEDLVITGPGVVVAAKSRRDNGDGTYTWSEATIETYTGLGGGLFSSPTVPTSWPIDRYTLSVTGPVNLNPQVTQNGELVAVQVVGDHRFIADIHLSDSTANLLKAYGDDALSTELISESITWQALDLRSTTVSDLVHLRSGDRLKVTIADAGLSEDQAQLVLNGPTTTGTTISALVGVELILGDEFSKPGKYTLTAEAGVGSTEAVGGLTVIVWPDQPFVPGSPLIAEIDTSSQCHLDMELPTGTTIADLVAWYALTNGAQHTTFGSLVDDDGHLAANDVSAPAIGSQVVVFETQTTALYPTVIATETLHGIDMIHDVEIGVPIPAAGANFSLYAGVNWQGDRWFLDPEQYMVRITPQNAESPIDLPLDKWWSDTAFPDQLRSTFKMSEMVPYHYALIKRLEGESDRIILSSEVSKLVEVPLQPLSITDKPEDFYVPVDLPVGPNWPKDLNSLSYEAFSVRILNPFIQGISNEVIAHFSFQPIGNSSKVHGLSLRDYDWQTSIETKKIRLDKAMPQISNGVLYYDWKRSESALDQELLSVSVPHESYKPSVLFEDLILHDIDDDYPLVAGVDHYYYGGYEYSYYYLSPVLKPGKVYALEVVPWEGEGHDGSGRIVFGDDEDTDILNSPEQGTDGQHRYNLSLFRPYVEIDGIADVTLDIPVGERLSDDGLVGFKVSGGPASIYIGVDFLEGIEEIFKWAGYFDLSGIRDTGFASLSAILDGASLLPSSLSIKRRGNEKDNNGYQIYDLVIIDESSTFKNTQHGITLEYKAYDDDFDGDNKHASFNLPMVVHRLNESIQLIDADGNELFQPGLMSASLNEYIGSVPDDRYSTKLHFDVKMDRDGDATLTFEHNPGTEAQGFVIHVAQIRNHRGRGDSQSAMVGLGQNGVVDLSSGTVHLDYPLITFDTPVPGPDLHVFYNSHDAFSHGLAQGWTHSFSSRLWQDDRLCAVLLGNGQRVFFQRNGLPDEESLHKGASFKERPYQLIDNYGNEAADSPNLTLQSDENSNVEIVTSGSGLGSFYSSDQVEIKSYQNDETNSWRDGEAFLVLFQDGTHYYYNEAGYLVRIMSLQGYNLNIALDDDGRVLSVSDDLEGINQRTIDFSTLSASFGITIEGNQLKALSGESGPWEFDYRSTGLPLMERITRKGSVDAGVWELIEETNEPDPEASRSWKLEWAKVDDTDRVSLIDGPGEAIGSSTRIHYKMNEDGEEVNDLRQVLVQEEAETTGGTVTAAEIGARTHYTLSDERTWTRMKQLDSGYVAHRRFADRLLWRSWLGAEQFTAENAFARTEMTWYRDRGQPKTRTVYNGHDGEDRVHALTTYTYRQLIPNVYLPESIIVTRSDGAPLLAIETPTNKLVTSYTYYTDADSHRFGLLETVTEPADQPPEGAEGEAAFQRPTQSFGYNSDGFLSSRSDALGNTWQYRDHTPYGHAQTLIEPHDLETGATTIGQVTQTYYDNGQQGRLHTATDGFLQEKVTYEYDLRGVLKKVILPDNRGELAYITDPYGRNLLTSTPNHEEGSVLQSLTVYDEEGRLAKRKEPGSAAVTISYMPAAMPDESGDLGWKISRNQGATKGSSTYVDFAGRTRSGAQTILKEISGIDSSLQLTGVVSEESHTRYKWHEHAPWVIAIHDPRSPSDLSSDIHATLIERDHQGREIKRSLPSQRLFYDTHQTNYPDLVSGTQTEYTVIGQPYRVTTPYIGGEDSVNAISTLIYNRRGQVLRSISPEGRRWINSYDQRGLLRRSKPPLGAGTEYLYDAAGRHTATTDLAWNITTQQTFDIAARAIELNQSHNSKPLQRYRKTSIATGHSEISVQTPFGSSTTELTKRQSAKRHKTPLIDDLVMAYNPEDGRANGSHRETDGGIGYDHTALDYDEDLGRASKSYDSRSGSLLARLWDVSTGYFMTTADNVAASADHQTTDALQAYPVAWDAAGRVTRMDYPLLSHDGKDLSKPSQVTVYDDDGRISSVSKVKRSDASLIFSQTSTTYDAAGRVQRQVLSISSGNGPVSASALQERRSTTTIYNRDGEVIKRTVQRPGRSGDLVTTLIYNDLGQVIRRASAQQTTYYGYLADSRQLIAQATDAELTVYAYDTLGQQTTVERIERSGTSWADSDLIAAAFSPGGLFHEVAQTDAATLVDEIDGVVKQFSYDPHGRVKSQTEKNRTDFYRYKNHQLTDVVSTDGRSRSFGYDGRGQLVEETRALAMEDETATVRTVLTEAANEHASATLSIGGQNLPVVTGRTLTISEFLNGVTSPETTSTVTLDRRRRMVSEQLGDQAATTQEWSTLDQMLAQGDRVMTPDASGRQRGYTDHGAVIGITRNGLGQVLSETLEQADRSLLTRTYDYASDGLLASVTEEVDGGADDGKTWQYTINARDIKNRLRQVTDPTGQTFYRYDVDDALLVERLLVSDPSLRPHRLAVTAFDANGNRLGQRILRGGDDDFGRIYADQSLAVSGDDQRLYPLNHTGDLGPEFSLTIHPEQAQLGSEMGLRFSAGSDTVEAVIRAADLGAQQWQLMLKRIPATGPPEVLARSTAMTLPTSQAMTLTVVRRPDGSVVALVEGERGDNAAVLEARTALNDLGGMVNLLVRGAHEHTTSASFSSITFDTPSDWVLRRASYGSDGRDELQSTTTTFSDGTAAIEEVFEHDAYSRIVNREQWQDGSRIARQTYRYDARDRVTEITYLDGSRETHRYHAGSALRRSSERFAADGSSQGVESYHYVGNELQAHQAANDVITRYLKGGQGTIGEWKDLNGSGQRLLGLARDLHGHNVGTIGSTDGAAINSSSVIDRLSATRFDAWGETQARWQRNASTGTLDLISTPLTTPITGPGYRGLWNDSRNGSIWMRHRLYDPSLGRFTQEDPARAGGNWMAYAGGDPVNRWDPSGLYWRYYLDSNGKIDSEWIDDIDDDEVGLTQHFDRFEDNTLGVAEASIVNLLRQAGPGSFLDMRFTGDDLNENDVGTFFDAVAGGGQRSAQAFLFYLQGGGQIDFIGQDDFAMRNNGVSRPHGGLGTAPLFQVNLGQMHGAQGAPNTVASLIGYISRPDSLQSIANGELHMRRAMPRLTRLFNEGVRSLFADDNDNVSFGYYFYQTLAFVGINKVSEGFLGWSPGKFVNEGDGNLSGGERASSIATGYAQALTAYFGGRIPLRPVGRPTSGRPALPSGYHYRTANGRSVVARNPGRAGDLPPMHLQGGRLVEGAASTARNTGGRWLWSNVRARLGKSGWARPNQDVHHWLIPRNGWGRVVPDIIKNRKWNLMRMSSRSEHFHVHGWSFNGQPGYGLFNRLWRGSPLPAKLTIGGGLAAGGAAYYYGSE